MKYIKILGLLSVAAAACMAFAGVASATTITSPAGTTYLGALHAESEGHATLHNPIAKIECASTVTGDVEVNGKEEGGKTLAASGKITSLLFSPCTNSWHVTTATNGSGEPIGGTLSITSNGAGKNTGDLVSTGATVESTRLGVICRYVTNNTTIGTVTGGTPATLHIEANIPFHNGSGLCGTTPTAWTGSYKVTSPGTLLID